MNKKRALVTGANSGMGLATTIQLAALGYHVIMACRSEQRGEQALQEAKIKSQSNHIELMILDLASLESIRNFAKQSREKYQTLDVLVNNAGVLAVKRRITADGFESMLGVNHLGHFLLTNLLLEQIVSAAQGRIVTVASSAHTMGKIDFDDPHLENKYSLLKGYSQSKLANILFTLELSERLKGTNVIANCLDPGPVSTNIGVNRKQAFWGRVFHAFMKPFIPNPQKGAQTAVYLADSAEVAQITGKYFYKKKLKSPSSTARDPKLAKKLWEWSELQVGMH